MKLFGMLNTKDSQAYTAHALKSFFKHTTLAAEDRFVLIDNDASYPADSLPPAVHLLKNPKPLGFSDNANQLVDLALSARADLLLMNNDIILGPDWLQPLLTDPHSIVSPFSNRELQYKGGVFEVSMIMHLEQYLGKENEFDQLCKIHQAATIGYNKVLVVPFFCVRIPHAILQAIGHFDASFGKGGGEDYDYCLCAYLAGFGVKYAIPSFVLHFGGKSSWSGVESREQQDQRELLFRTRFGVKWGMDLLKLILFEDREIAKEGTQLFDEIKLGNHRRVIEILKGENYCELRL